MIYHQYFGHPELFLKSSNKRHSVPLDVWSGCSTAT
jgi:hypothetical protein